MTGLECTRTYTRVRYARRRRVEVSRAAENGVGAVLRAQRRSHGTEITNDTNAHAHMDGEYDRSQPPRRLPERARPARRDRQRTRRARRARSRAPARSGRAPDLASVRPADARGVPRADARLRPARQQRAHAGGARARRAAAAAR